MRQDAQPTGAEETVDVLAERFSFTPSEIKTTSGTTLQIRLESDDTAHGFRIIGTDVNIEIPKRGAAPTTVTFKAEKAGALHVRMLAAVRRRPLVHARRDCRPKPARRSR